MAETVCAVVIDGNAYKLQGDTLLTAPVYSDGTVYVNQEDEWSEVESEDDATQRARVALDVLHGGDSAGLSPEGWARFQRAAGGL